MGEGRQGGAGPRSHSGAANMALGSAYPVLCLAMPGWSAGRVHRKRPSEELGVKDR